MLKPTTEYGNTHKILLVAPWTGHRCSTHRQSTSRPTIRFWFPGVRLCSECALFHITITSLIFQEAELPALSLTVTMQRNTENWEKAINLKSNLIHEISNNFQFDNTNIIFFSSLLSVDLVSSLSSFSFIFILRFVYFIYKCIYHMCECVCVIFSNPEADGFEHRVVQNQFGSIRSTKSNATLLFQSYIKVRYYGIRYVISV